MFFLLYKTNEFSNKIGINMFNLKNFPGLFFPANVSGFKVISAVFRAGEKALILTAPADDRRIFTVPAKNFKTAGLAAMGAERVFFWMAVIFDLPPRGDQRQNTHPQNESWEMF